MNTNKSSSLRRGAWTEEEDSRLRKCIEKYGTIKWCDVPTKAGLNRCRKSCRLRWLNYLSPNIKRGRFEEDENELIIRLHKLLGNRWSLIAGRIPGRTANDIKNHWNTHLSKRVVLGEKPKQTRKGFEVIRPQPQTIATNWWWAKDQEGLQGHSEPTPNPTCLSVNNEDTIDGTLIGNGASNGVLASFGLHENLGRIGDDDSFLGQDGGWDDLLREMDF